jgi:hypothetical protein
MSEPNQEREKPIGAIWIKKSKDGQNTYISGEIEVGGKKQSFIGFKNRLKDDAKYPDYRLFVRRPPTTGGASRAAEPKKPTAPPAEDGNLDL